ncbi:FAD-dependent oxidoreductase [Agromyces aurantiacus]|uniref:FAD-dependent oxidoreductase n=1 Tax=Agromyces aurantiacus TaxID=165814 RepID=A0ABV9R3W0_9MICO|nr:FAD-dependent oxidoreductase [Agromyces aurantiacus]MBM7502807.1 NADPH-dependent 2,4-dienoyl-CoA reductase/sulfur reductase-like enzyme/rhodanese-related sulfurtransferase [Agromyces aurantiacus]
MTSQRYLIIGGVAGGMSAATRLRRLDEHAQITVLERGGHVSFANCGLPYYLGGVIEERSSLLLQSPASLGSRFGLDVRVRTEAVAIDRDAKTVLARDLATGEERTLEYDALVLSPGATPVRPPIEGGERMLTLRDIDDVDAAMAALEVSPRSALVIGAGFIGLEMVENLAHRGLDVTLVELGEQVLPPLDPEMAAPVAERLREAGVDVRLGTQVTALGPDTATLSDGTTVAAEFVLGSIGVRPDTSLATAAGLELGPRGGIRVDDALRTSDPHIWAIGDAVEKVDAITGEPRLVALAGLANRHGRLAADAITGRDIRVRDALGTAVVGLMGLTIAATGWNEKLLRSQGRDIRVIHTHPASHTGYYPGAETMALKLLVDAGTDAILGAQGVGGEGVDKRIDVIATAMAGGITASELADLELAYAPQYSSAKDPVNMLGYVALNALEGLTPSIQWHELDAAVDAGATVVDVRTAAEVADGAIPGSLRIPLDELRTRADELPAGRLIVHCKVGQRGHTAVRLLAQLGRDAVNLDGGYLTWKAGMASRTAVEAEALAA